MTDLSNPEARRVALGAQGLLNARPSNPPAHDDLHATLRQMGLVQLDTINVITRSHYIPFFSRHGLYDVSDLDAVTWGAGKAFEYWGHVASIMPSEQYPLFGFRRKDLHDHWSLDYLDKHEAPGYIETVFEQVQARGPLKPSDLDNPGIKLSNHMWARGTGKLALEYLFACGRVTTSHRVNFQRFYDLPDRVLPAELLNGGIPRDEAQRELILIAAKCHGVATASDLADYYRIKMPEARKRITELVDAGALEKLQVEGWREPAYALPNLQIPRSEPAARCLVTPFDPIVWKRDRALRLFGFDYTIEIYVPEKKRVFGYYVLPFLVDGRFVARVDVKADRAGDRLLARAAYLEEGEDPLEVSTALAKELRLMAEWLGLSRTVVGRRGNLSDAIRKELRGRRAAQDQ